MFKCLMKATRELLHERKLRYCTPVCLLQHQNAARILSLHADQGDCATGASAIPEAPKAALPRLAALSRAPPSPLLQWQLLEILYAYCSTMHLFQGDWAFDAMVSHPDDGCTAPMPLHMY